MFEDLITRKKSIEKRVKEALTDEACPYCSSVHISTIDGIFLGGNYVQTYICVTCSATWTVTYDQDLNIID